MSADKEKKDYDFGGIKEFNLEEIEKEVLNDSVYLDVFAGSDQAFKTDINPLTNPLEKLAMLDAVTYNYKPETGFSKEPQVGFIAQEVEKVVPVAVATDEAGMKYVNYASLAPILVESVKELSKQVEEQSKIIADLQSQLSKKQKILSINVHTEWGKLKEVVVGSCVNLSDYNVDLSFKLFFHDNIKDELLKNSISLQRKLIEQREEDLNAMAALLESMGIVVMRPRKLELVSEFETPNFKDHNCPVDNPRDQTLILGNEIIETPCIWRRRYFENDLMKDIFMHYFKAGAKWTSAPRPEMKAESFDLSYVQRKDSKIDWTEYDSLEKNFEIMFDGAQCLKFGKDIVMNIANENHRLGLKWLQSHVGEKYKIHPVELTDHHIDGMFMPLRPGVLLINPSSMKDKIDLLPKELRSWDIIEVPEEHQSIEKGPIQLASSNINVNVLPLDEEKVLVFDESGDGPTALMKNLEAKGFTPINIRLRHSRIFGGGAHCVSLDTVREDKLEDFFS